MAGYNGREVLLEINSGTPQAPVWDAAAQGEQGLEFDKESAEIETTVKRSGRRGEFITGRINETGTVRGLLAFDEIGLGLIRDAQDSGDVIRLRQTRFGLPEREFDAVITNFRETANDNEAASFEITFRVTGDPVAA